MAKADLMALEALMGVTNAENADHNSALEEAMRPERKDRAQQAHEEKLEESKRGLKAELTTTKNERDTFKTRYVRAQYAIKVLAGLTTLALMGCTGMFFYVQAGRARALDEAFKIIHYRENKALGANVVVLDEWAKQMEGLKEKIQTVDGVSDEERSMRIKTCDAAIRKADVLRDGFLAQIKENDKERGVGASFSYKDPFLKKEIKLSEENGGEIDMDKIKEEVKEQAKLDSTMKDMEKAMLSPIPLAAQVKAAAEEAQKNMPPQVKGQPQVGGQFGFASGAGQSATTVP